MKVWIQRLIVFVLLGVVGVYWVTSTRETEIDTLYKEGFDEYLVHQWKYPLKLVDSSMNKVIIKEEPMRIISLGPNITETLFALNAGDKIIGKTEFCDYPEATKMIPAISNGFIIDVTKIIELNPDLVIASTSLDIDIIEQLKDEQIPVLSLFEEDSFKGLFFLIGNLGLVVNRQEEAQTLMAEMESIISQIEEMVKELESPSLFFVSDNLESTEYDKSNVRFFEKMVELVGAKNVSRDYKHFDRAKLLEQDPDIVVILKSKPERVFVSIEAFEDLTAVKEHRVYEFDEDLFLRQGPRVIDGLVALANVVHPEVFEGWN